MASPEDMASAMKENSLADVVHDIGYAFTTSVEVCKNNMLNFDAREPSSVDVAKTISTMIRYRASSQDGPQIQTPGNFWMSLEKDTISHGTGEWNAEVFVQTVKELAPNLNWKDVVLQLDHQQFLVPDSAALNLLFAILRLGLRSAGHPPNVFPVEYLYRRWTNLEGQMSLISNILKHPDIFSFADHPINQISIDFLKSYPETENKEVGTWRSLHLVELLLYAGEHGYYVLVTELFKLPLQHCPDVLFLVLMQLNPPITPVRQELLKILIPIFFADHPNSGMILCRAWHSQNLNVKSIIMHAMADWYLRGECDHFRLSRILDIAQDLKALSLLLNIQSFPFVIDLACLASRREYLKLDKWLTDKIRDNGETFVAALAQFSQKRYPIILAKRSESQMPKPSQLPHETITTIMACLQMCIPNVQHELQEVIYNVIADYQAMVLNKTRYMRNLETPNDSVGLGAHSLVSHSDPITMLTSNIGNMSLGAPTPNTTLPMYDISVSPSKTVGATNSPSAKMSIQYNPNVTNIGIRGRVTPALALDKPRIQDPVPYPEVTHVIAKEIEDEANSYFKRIYNHPGQQSLSIDEALDMLKKFQDSPNKREREVFSYMLQNLFEEYKFFPQYPERELHTTAQLFGGIIEKGLVPSYVSLGLLFVLDALKKGEGTKMYYFGIAALDRFKSRLKDYHKYCEHVRAIPYFNKFPRYIIEYVEYGLKSQEPPAKLQELGLAENAGAASSPYSDFVPRSIVSTPSVSMVSEMTTAASASRPSIANVTNINTLLTATDDSEEITTPPEAIQDKTAFIFNNLSQLNLQPKCEELKKIITEEYFPWLSRYLVMNRVSIELNFHTLYANFLDVYKAQELNKLVTKETYRNIKVLLRSDKEMSNFTDRSLLKNFGHWLGLLTLARNLPILFVDIDLKAMLLEAYHRGRQYLLYIVPFVAKVLQSCSKSVVFKPPNPWMMALMNVLAELHEEPNLELNLKFEVEVLCKNLSLDVADLKPAIYLRDKKKLKNIMFQLSSQPIEEHEDARAKPAMKIISPQPMKHRQEAVSTAIAMPVSQATVQTPMLAPTETLTELVPLPNDPTFMGMLGLPEPRFNYHDINVTSTAVGHNIFFNPNIILFQNYPHLKQLVKPAIERSIQEWIHPVVDRAIKYALTTCEQIIRKDFALDPEEMRMRTCAHNMMRNLTAGMAMISCREQVTLTMSANLKAAFTAALIPATPHQDAIENAATNLAADNMELACAFIQKTAVEKALPEVDKCLMSDYEIRKLAREEGRRYYDPIEFTYQTEMIPERCRMRVGAPRDLQMSVYEEFARKIPGFAPVTDTGLFALKPAQEVQISQQLTYNPVLTPSQVYGTDEINTLITAAEVYLGSALTAALARNMHSLLECLCLERRNRDIVSRCTLLQKAVEGILTVALSATADLETTRYRDIHLRVLKVLEAVYGHVWTSKQITCCLAECREEIRYNVEAVDCLIRNRLVNLPQYDIVLTQMMDNGNNYTAVAFAMQLLQLYLDDNTFVTESDLHHTKDLLTRVITHSRQLEGLAPLIETVRVDMDPGTYDGKRSLLGPTAHIHSEIMQVRSKNYDDPPGLKEKTEIFLKDWNNFLLSPLTEINLQRNFNLYINHMNMNTIFSSIDLTIRFLRISIRMCIENVYEELSKDRMNPPNDPAAREKYYVMCDSFVKLVSMLVKNTDEGNPIPKLNLLNKVLGIITGSLLRDHEERSTGFQQLPYHRLLLMLLFDMTLEPTLDSINCQVVTSFCHALHIVRPAVAAGFSFSWLEIVSHRVLIDRVLADNPHQKGWGMYSTLVMDLFKFLDPFLRNNEVAPPVMTLYKGTLKVLLVLLHDFPEFLCDYHYAFCDVISPNCIQMRNLVLSAFPRNMRMPDPLSHNLKVDLLSEIALPPRSVVNYATLVPSSQFKKDLDTYLNARAPVTFLSELRRNMQVVHDSVRRYNSQLMNAVVLYVGTQAIASIRAKGEVPRMATIAHSAYMDIFQNISVDFDDEGRYLFLNAIANQLRYPNSHTHYFSCVLLYLFAEANSETIQIQITRMLLERLIVNRPHPWGVLITFIELIKNPVYNFWQREFVNYVPEIEHYEKLPSLYNYIVEKVIYRISGRKDRNYEADIDN